MVGKHPLKIANIGSSPIPTTITIKENLNYYIDFGVYVSYNETMAYKDPNDERAKASRRKHYLNNKEQYYANNKLKKMRMRKFLWSIKSVPCMDCGGRFPPHVMDFDHREPDKKLASINTFLCRQSWTKLKEEIAKCDIVCANCHRMRTASLLGYKDFELGSGNESLSKSD